METPPTFFYSPNAYALGIIAQEAITCQCCGKARAFRYTGNLYTAATVKQLCPWCIADGSAADKYGGSFVSDFEGLNPDPAAETGLAMSPASMEQVSSRTPGYASWQGDVWLGHCGEACIFLGYAGGAELATIWAEVEADAVASGWGKENIRDYMHKDGDMTGYLFRCQHCGQHRLHVDAN
ncbi:CbrC family protein [Hymenobacter sp. DH14]|uniref:CbrC family protein n=1 Tax=Hymenobacter cyanobacteriorum TaxID=2926463 RepID=A0A9X1VEC3_9BACT|nr:CbrC family protein [Hymenobacter cyanobacteriorum]MCI1187619.1 CbrC family protein [Hymenobacter cyanobacteriorum]